MQNGKLKLITRAILGILGEINPTYLIRNHKHTTIKEFSRQLRWGAKLTKYLLSTHNHYTTLSVIVNLPLNISCRYILFFLFLILNWKSITETAKQSRMSSLIKTKKAYSKNLWTSTIHFSTVVSLVYIIF